MSVKFFPRHYFSPNDPAGTTPPVTDPTPPATTPPATDPPAADPPTAPPSNGDDNKYRRLFEKTEAEKKALEAELKQRKDADLSESEREKQARVDAEKRAAELEAENLRLKHGKDLPEEALEFLTATDEAGIKDQAEKLLKLYPKAPPKAGTHTNPPGNQGPTIDERIKEAEKSGNRSLSIQLKREKIGLSN